MVGDLGGGGPETIFSIRIQNAGTTDLEERESYSETKLAIVSGDTVGATTTGTLTRRRTGASL